MHDQPKAASLHPLGETRRQTFNVLIGRASHDVNPVLITIAG